jgi:1-phosphofructokinase
MMQRPSLAVFAPSPILTIMVEAIDSDNPEIHLHAGGQGFWVARMAALLGGEVSLCCALGGESGAVLRGLISRENVDLRSIERASPNGVYVHVRREGERQELVRTEPATMSRHEVDELYGVALSSALDARVALLTGVDPPGVLDSDVYRRLAGDLRRNGILVIADLAGAPLDAALAGGLDLLKISEEELARQTPAGVTDPASRLDWLQRVHRAGAQNVLISRAQEPALAFVGSPGRYLELTGPRVEALEPKGTGDSMFAALGTGLASGRGMPDALRMAMAAGCLNATRHGLGTGTRQEIERLSRHVEIRELSPPAPEQPGAAP